ncbi:hypothetical protein ACF0H5_020323 [Mactra antiquata]
MKYFQAILWVTILTTVNTCSEYDFQVNEDTDAIKEYVRYGHYIELKCCSRDTTVEVTWYKWDNDTWVTLDSSSGEYQFHHHRQVLSINSASFDDEGLYKCSKGISGTSLLSNRQFDVQVIPCDTLARGPFPIAPLSCSKTDAKIGYSLTLPCTGYFGCGEKDDMRLVTWLVSPLDKDNMWKPVSEINDERYVTTTFSREGYSVLGSNLTIHRVQEIDFNRKFMCVLASPQMIDGQTKLVVELKNDGDVSLQKAVLSPQTLVILVTVVTVLIFISIVISALAIYKTMTFKQTRSKRTISRSPICLRALKDSENKEFDV